jgi:hypothetical protein
MLYSILYFLDILIHDCDLGVVAASGFRHQQSRPSELAAVKDPDDMTAVSQWAPVRAQLRPGTVFRNGRTPSQIRWAQGPYLSGQFLPGIILRLPFPSTACGPLSTPLFPWLPGSWPTSNSP